MDKMVVEDAEEIPPGTARTSVGGTARATGKRLGPSESARPLFGHHRREGTLASHQTMVVSKGIRLLFVPLVPRSNPPPATPPSSALLNRTLQPSPQ
jgi:hypothetical protein